MQYKKLIGTVLTSVLVGTQLLGCGSNEAAKEAGAGQGTVKEGVTQSETQGGEEKKPPLKFSMSRSTNNNQYALSSPDINKDKWVQELNQRANIELDLILFDHGKLSEQMQLMFASGDIPDVVWTYGDWKDKKLSGAVEAGVFMPLDDLLETNQDKLADLMNEIPEQAWIEARTDYDQKIYGIPVGYLGVPALNGTFIRQDLLEKYQLEVPSTLDEAVEVLKVFKQNGMEFPYSGRERWSYTTTFLEPFGVAMNRWNVNDDGDLVPDIIRPEMKEALAFHGRLIKEGLMNPEFLTTSGGDWSNSINAGKVGVFTHQAQGLSGWNNGIKDSVSDGQFALIPAVEGPRGHKGSTISPTIQASVFVNKNFKEPERFLEFLNWCSTEEAKEFFTFGIEGEDYTKVNGEIQYVPTTDSVRGTEDAFRLMLGIVGDGSHNKLMLHFAPGGEEVLNYFENIGPKEGYHAYKTPETMQSLENHPDLVPERCDLFYEYAAKIVLGQIPVDDFDKFVAEYLRRGGDKVIREATELYKAGKLIKY